MTLTPVTGLPRARGTSVRPVKRAVPPFGGPSVRRRRTSCVQVAHTWPPKRNLVVTAVLLSLALVPLSRKRIGTPVSVVPMNCSTCAHEAPSTHVRQDESDIRGVHGTQPTSPVEEAVI